MEIVLSEGLHCLGGDMLPGKERGISVRFTGLVLRKPVRRKCVLQSAI